jgi:hypothetical protein
VREGGERGGMTESGGGGQGRGVEVDKRMKRWGGWKEGTGVGVRGAMEGLPEWLYD